MGLDDSHWCSKCGKELDKRRDEYVEMNFNNWKSMHIKYIIAHTPDDKEVHTALTHKEAEHYVDDIPKGELEDKNPENYRIITRAVKMKKSEMTELFQKHDRVFLCKTHYIELMLEQIEHLRECGNPIFHCSIICWDWKECSFYESPDRPPIPITTTPCEAANMGEPEKYQEPNCKHICAIDDVIYCKRRHPGAVVLTVEDTMIQARRLREAPIYTREILKKFMEGIYNIENRRTYLECFPEGPMRESERVKFDASMKMIEQILMQQMKTVEADEGSNFFKTQTGDHMLYVEVCEDKILVKDPDKKKEETEQPQ